MSNDGKIIWKIVYLIVIFIATFIGNALVIMVVYRSSRNQWTTNHFVVSLAIVNFLAPTVYLLLSLDSSFRDEWLFGNIGCKLHAFLVHFNALTSVAILCCMSFDRYYLTAYPLTFKLSKKQTKKVIVAVWILAASVACPVVFFYELHSTSCEPELTEKWAAYVCCLSILFLLPHFTTYATYYKLCRCIQARNNNPNRSRFVQKVPRTKIKVAKLLVAQVIVHTVLWLPYVTYQLVISFAMESDEILLSSLAHVTYASSGASPLIYSIFSADFRRGCKLIFNKYDASVAYRLPMPLERRNKVEAMISDPGNFPMLRTSGKQKDNTVSRRASEQQPGNRITFFDQPRVAWSQV